MNFKDQIVLVTGSTKGIGLEIAKRFAAEGATVVICGRNGELASKISQELRQKGHRAEGFACDVANMQNVEELANKILDKFKSIDILINNAGVTRDKLLLRLSEEDWDTVLDTNLKGTFNCSKVIETATLKAKKGKIINIESIIGMTGKLSNAN